MLQMRHVLPHQPIDRPRPPPRAQRRAEVQRLARGKQLDGQHVGDVPGDLPRLSGGDGAMLTWSSWLPDVGIESTTAGEANTLFSDTSAAAVYCAIIMPELSPPCSVRNGGSPESCGFTMRSVRRSEMLASSERAIPRKSMAMATGSPWKLPPLSTSPSSGNSSGLSVAEFISVSTTARA